MEAIKHRWRGPYTEAPDERQVSLCLEWLKLYATPRKTVNRHIGSYGLKHVVERWAGEYISNGALIEAVRRQGWDIVPIGDDNPNAYFRLAYDRQALAGKRQKCECSETPTADAAERWLQNGAPPVDSDR